VCDPGSEEPGPLVSDCKEGKKVRVNLGFALL
jgi:hypothetical protein